MSQTQEIKQTQEEIVAKTTAKKSEKFAVKKEKKKTPAKTLNVVVKEKTLEEWMAMGLSEEEAKIMMKGKAKKEAEKKSAEELKKEREEYEVSSGLAEKRAALEILKNEIKDLEEARSDLYKKGRGLNPASKEELAVRFKKNKEGSSKNIFCKHGDGVNGELEEKHGGKKITGCGYICRSVKTMEKHLLKCKYASGEKK